MKKIITGMTLEPVSDQELAAARDYMINSFMFGFTSPASIVSQRARLEFYGYPENYLENYRNAIAGVSKEDVLNAARKYLKPGAFKLVIVGDAAKFGSQLSSLGSVRELDLNLNIPR
jgi:predicted Zn-dependent peptidase